MWMCKNIVVEIKDFIFPFIIRQFTTDDLMMSETLGLVKTLGWKVVDGIILQVL